MIPDAKRGRSPDTDLEEESRTPGIPPGAAALASEEMFFTHSYSSVKQISGSHRMTNSFQAQKPSAATF